MRETGFSVRMGAGAYLLLTSAVGLWWAVAMATARYAALLGSKAPEVAAAVPRDTAQRYTFIWTLATTILAALVPTAAAVCGLATIRSRRSMWLTIDLCILSMGMVGAAWYAVARVTAPNNPSNYSQLAGGLLAPAEPWQLVLGVVATILLVLVLRELNRGRGQGVTGARPPDAMGTLAGLLGAGDALVFIGLTLLLLVVLSLSSITDGTVDPVPFTAQASSLLPSLIAAAGLAAAGLTLIAVAPYVPRSRLFLLGYLGVRVVVVAVVAVMGLVWWPLIPTAVASGAVFVAVARAAAR